MPEGSYSRGERKAEETFQQCRSSTVKQRLPGNGDIIEVLEDEF